MELPSNAKYTEPVSIGQYLLVMIGYQTRKSLILPCPVANHHQTEDWQQSCDEVTWL